MVLDYSKFESIEDSDDEREATAQKPAGDALDTSECRSSKSSVPSIPCSACSGLCSKPLRCGKCRSATYCSASCQKEDWSYHKRTCKPFVPMEQALQSRFPGMVMHTPGGGGGEGGDSRPSKEPAEKAKVEEYLKNPPSVKQWEKEAGAKVSSKISQEESSRISDAADCTGSEPEKQVGLASASDNIDDIGQQQGACMCLNCKKACAKAMKCGVCKVATYCSTDCQKQDWRFHKRNCKKWTPPVTCWCGAVFKEGVHFCSTCGARRPDEGRPVPTPASASPEDREAAIATLEAAGLDLGDLGSKAKKQESPCQKEPAPSPKEAAACLAEEAAGTPVEEEATAAEAPPPSTDGKGSAWNTAGTWEEKRMLRWWSTLLPSLAGASYGALTMEKIEDITGDASIVYIRGTARFFFDLEFRVEFAHLGEDGITRKGHAKVTDVSNDLWEELRVEDVTGPPELDTRQIQAQLVPWLKHGLRVCISQYEAQK